mmetsp:Transcript_40829/g.73726  ORF Transcript_40829/g.73726 Transcript_40829/m.73726 type:complete len:447 (-) Transcript_40829:85-1425(-)
MADHHFRGSPSLEDFKHVKLLGEGAFAAVFKVIRHADGDVYALKKVKLPSLSDKEKQNALNEIRLLASIQHENIISYKDAFFDDRTRCLCIITEYANEGDLMNRIVKYQKERARMPEGHLWRYVIGLARALDALHDINIYHRDLKSANVFLSSSGGKTIAKLGDFNVSTVAKRGLCMTQTGTPYYASPEIWRDTPYDGKSDLWALGCVMYEAAVLKPPFRGEDMEGLYRSVLRGQYKKLPPVYSKDYSDLIASLLQVNPRDRPSAEELLNLPSMKRRAAELGLALAVPGDANLLSTIKVPGRLADLSPFLPEPQYDAQVVGEAKVPHIDDYHAGRTAEHSRKEDSSRDRVRLPSLDRNRAPAEAVDDRSRHSSQRTRKKKVHHRSVARDALLQPDAVLHAVQEEAAKLQDQIEVPFAPQPGALAPLLPPLKARPAVVQSVRLPRIA